MSDEIARWNDEHGEVTWDGRLCIHVSECTRAKGELFESGRDPWAKPETGSPEYVAEVCQRCPTGALTYKPNNGQPAESAPAANRVTVANNGPLYVEGDLKIDGAADDMPGVAFRAALCRCGASKNKPFCDNAHEGIGFRDNGAIGETGTGIDAPGGRLEINRAEDGPLLLSGNLTMLTSSGREAWKGTKAALCRCGASKNKPFCDGAHKVMGFKAD